MLRGLRAILNSQQNLVKTSAIRNYSYESDISLKNLYPKSKQELFTPEQPAATPGAQFNGHIPINQLTITYSRSSGPGGQNVNKLDTKVDVRFAVKTSEWIPETVRGKLLEKYKNQINKEGYFVIKSDLTRHQHLNLADALERLRNIIRALEKESEVKETSPEKLAEIQRRHEKAARERLFVKRFRSQTKSDRNVG